MSAIELFEAGNLAGAVDEALKEVKSKPTDVSARFRLVLLFCYNGELERADKQLTTLSAQQPEAAVGSALLRQLIRAELARHEFHSQGRVPEFVEEPSELMKMHVKASIFMREGETEEAAQLLADAEDLRPKVSGTCDGQEFEDLRDLDDLMAPVLEALTSTGKYYWIPTSDVIALEFQKPESLADLLWRPIRLTLQEGPPGAIYMPTLYVGSWDDPEESVRLGRATEWDGLEQPPVRGRGLRMFLAGEDSKSIFDIEHLQMKNDVSKPTAAITESEDGQES